MHCAAQTTQDVSSAMGDVLVATRETSNVATQLQAAAGELSQLAENVRSEGIHFLNVVRAG